MKYVKWIFVVLLICSLTSFVEKNKLTGGFLVGEKAPSFQINTSSYEQPTMELSDLKGKYVLLSFWASYDASSRVSNISLNHALSTASSENIEMVSISFDKYASIFDETIRQDQIVSATCFVDTQGEDSRLFKRYRLNKGFTNYLLDQNGVIIAKDISAADLLTYLN